MGSIVKTAVAVGTPYNYTARIKIVIQSLALTEELRRENDIAAVIFLSYFFSITHRYGALDNHYGTAVHLQNEFYDLLYVSGVKRVLDRVIVSRSGYHHKVGISVSGCAVGSGMKVKLFLTEILLNIFISYRRTAVVYHVHLLSHNVDSLNMMMLAQQCCYAQANISCSGHGYSYIFKVHLHY